MRGGAGDRGQLAMTELAISPLGYGIPDFAAGAFNDPAPARGPAPADRGHDPPLRAAPGEVRVVLVDTATPLEATLRLRIEGLLHAEPAPEPIAFDTLVEAATAEVQVKAISGQPAARRTVDPMSDALLPYYERELDAIRRLAAEFADTHPKIAGRLRLAAETVDDPHVARLLEGMAFLAARVHHRLDDEFPELTDALLGLLYPHYLAPMPSCWRSPSSHASRT